MIKRVLRYGAGVLVGIGAVLAALYWGIVGTLYVAGPQPLDIAVRYAAENLISNGVALRVEQPVIAYDGNFVITAQKVELENIATRETAVADQVKLVVSNRNLFLGRLIFKAVAIEKLDVPLTLRSDVLDIAGVIIPLDEKSEDRPLEQVMQEIAGLLTGYGPPQARYLKSVDIKSIRLLFDDRVRRVGWLLDNARLKIARFAGEGDDATFMGDITGPDLASIPVIVRATRPPKGDVAELTLVLQHSNLGLVQAYVPADFKDFITGTGQVELVAKMNSAGTIVDHGFVIRLANGAIFPSQVYRKPLDFQQLTLTGQYSRKASDTLFVRDLSMLDVNGFSLQVSGTITALTSSPTFDLTLSGTPTTFHKFINYLPGREIPQTVNWLQKHVNDAPVKNIYLSYKGMPADFPHCGKSCGLFGRMDFKDVELKFFPHATPLTKAAGTFELKENFIHVAVPKGKLKKMEATNISATIMGLFEPGDTKLFLDADLTGPLNDAVALVMEEVSETIPGYVLGDHLAKLRLEKIFHDRPDEWDGLTFNYTADVKNLNMGLNHPSLTFVSDLASFSANQNNFSLQSTGKLNGVDAEVFWQESNTRTFGKNTALTLTGSIPPAVFNPLLLEQGVSVSNSVPFHTLISQTAVGAYNFQLTSSLDDVPVISTIINWKKPAGSEATLQAKGSYKEGMEGLDFQAISLTGKDVSIKGKAGWSVSRGVVFDLPILNIGKTVLTAVKNEKLLKVKGAVLDFSAHTKLWDLGDGDNADPLLANRKVEIDIKNVYLPAGSLKKVKINLQGENDYAISGNATMQMDTGDAVSMRIEKIKNTRNLFLSAANAGAFLRIIEFSPNIKGGQLLLSAATDMSAPETMRGLLKLPGIRVLKAPVLARLLSLISLEQLFSSGQGILFENVNIPFEKTASQLSVEKSHFDGPSIGLRFEGDIDLAASTMDMKGQLIPLSGINRVISDIPLIGDILTGSQEGLTVADFSLKGKLGEPDVSANPLSIVTPGLLKDFFDVFKSEKKNKKKKP